MDGLILVDKPQDLTSHDIVLQIRKSLNFQKIGHFGTLDPLATGLLLVAVGKATRLFPFFSKQDKGYEGRIRLGFSTDTYDCLGKPSSAENRDYPDRKKILKFIKQFKGGIQQIPPLFSAKKYRGKPLYKLAREKKEIRLKPSNVIIHSFELTRYDPPFLDFKVKCSSGTYIRSIAHDLGQSLGCGAHLQQLIRTEVGKFRLKEGLSLKNIEELVEKGEISSFLIPLESLLSEFPKIILSDKGTLLARNGRKIPLESVLKILPGELSLIPLPEEKETIFRLFSLEGKLLALAKRDTSKKHFSPFLVIN